MEKIKIILKIPETNKNFYENLAISPISADILMVAEGFLIKRISHINMGVPMVAQQK